MKNLKAYCTSGLAILAFAAGAALAAPGPLATGDTAVSTAAIRVTPDNGCKPVIHRNNAHPAPGVDRVEIVKGDARRGQKPDVLRVYMTHKSPVVDVKINTDEVMGTYGIDAGISGGVGHANIYFWDKSGKYVHPSEACGQSANWWLRIESQQ